MEYLALCMCTGRWFSHDISASGEAAVAWLAELEATRGPDLEKLSQFAASCPDAEANALKLTLRLRSHGDRAEIHACLDERELVLSNIHATPRGHEEHLRRATVTETSMLAARWLLGHERHGCSDPTEDAFWYERAQVAAYTMDQPDPTKVAMMPGWSDAFFAWIESDRICPRPGLLEALNDWSERHGADGATGLFLKDGAAGELWIAAVVETSAQGRAPRARGTPRRRRSSSSRAA